MSGAADRPLIALLDEIAATTPAPGGGSSAGWTCAVAAALVEMAAGFSANERISSRARELRAQALDLAQRELHAYEPVLVALKLPKSDPNRPGELDAALSAAAETPFALTCAAAEVAELAHEAAETGAKHLRGDALAGLHIAEGACRAAARLVEINLAGRAEDHRLLQLPALLERVRRLSSELRSPA